MHAKKFLLSVLSISLLIHPFVVRAVDPVQPDVQIEALEQGEVPLLSPKQLTKQYKDFLGYLNRVRRCLFTGAGACTREEMSQVSRHAWNLLKLVGLAVGAGFVYQYAPVKIRSALEGWKVKGPLGTTFLEVKPPKLPESPTSKLLVAPAPSGTPSKEEETPSKEDLSKELWGTGTYGGF